ncbi:MAG: hypothetical protein K2N89_01985 [Lachnospiraceae bacterium]|nr:hypothetical protein [Lachnospiraceae bacterium]
MDDLNEKAARRRKIAHAIEIVILIVLFICFIFPFILVLINVFKTKADITSNPLALVGELSIIHISEPTRHAEI